MILLFSHCTVSCSPLSFICKKKLFFLKKELLDFIMNYLILMIFFPHILYLLFSSPFIPHLFLYAMMFFLSLPLSYFFAEFSIFLLIYLLLGVFSLIFPRERISNRVATPVRSTSPHARASHILEHWISAPYSHFSRAWSRTFYMMINVKIMKIRFNWFKLFNFISRDIYFLPHIILSKSRLSQDFFIELNVMINKRF